MEHEPKNLTEQERSDLLKPVTPEMILGKKDLINKVCQHLATKKKEWIDKVGSDGRVIGRQVWERVDYQELIDFGEGYEKTNLATILFYIGYEKGLLAPSSWGAKPAEEYIKLLSEDEGKAEAYLNEYRSGMNESSFGWSEETDLKVRDFMADGFDLSTIVPGAPSLITTPPPEGNFGEPTFDPRETEFASSIMTDKTSKKELSDVLRDKTLIDLGAGAHPTGLQITTDLGIKNYVAVEPYNTNNLLFYTEIAVGNYFSEKQGSAHHPKKIHIAKTDMKTFLEKLPDNVDDSVFLISGIDEFILGTIPLDAVGRPAPRHIAEGLEYADSVVQELNRVLGKNSAVVMHNSIFDFTKPEYGFTMQKLETASSLFPTYIIRKSEK